MAKSPLLPGETPGEYLNRISGSGTIIAASRKVRQRKPRSRGFQHSQPTVSANVEPEKPDFGTALRAKRGDRQAQRKVNLWIKRQRAKESQARMVQALEDRALFGAAEGTIKGARKTVDPRAAAFIEAMSPTTSIEEAARALRHGQIGPAAVSALGILPSGRGTVAAARAARVARAAERGFQHAEKGAEKAAAASAKFEKNVRTVKVGEKEVQLPGGARSRVTRNVIEKPADAASRAIGKRRVPILHAGAEERGFKHAGRENHREAERALVEMTPHVKALPKEGSKKDVAHFWYAQLPSNLRNAKGLRAVRDMQANELQRIVNGERAAELERAKAAIQAELKATGDPSLLGDLERVKDLIDDLPNVQKEIAQSIARLDGLILKPPTLDPKVIDAVRELSGTRRKLLEGVGLLDEGTAAEREGLLSRTLGVGGGVSPRRIPSSLDPMTGRSDIGLGVDEAAQLMPRGDYLYHATSAESLPEISRSGLRAGRPRKGETSGAYLAEDGVDVTGLLPRRARGGEDVILRVKRSAAHATRTDMYASDSGFVEWVAPRGVKPEALEYLGADNAWHPIATKTSGEEIFIGHRLARPRGANPALVPTTPGLGKARPPQGVRQKNRAILIRQGQVRESTHVAAQDWRAAETYRSTLRARDDLFQMGDPFPGRVPEGYSLVNKKGRAVPASWKTDKLAQMVAEGANEDEILKAADEIVSGFLAEGDEAGKALIKATGAKAQDLRIVRNDLVKRYYSQIAPYRGSKAWKPYDMAIDAVMANLIFLRLGYIPKNAVQNLIMAVPHQGVFFLANLPRAAQVLADPQLRRLLAVEVGQGASGAVASEAATKALRAPAHVVTGVADTPFRISALLHELAGAGVIAKYNPVLTPTDRAALIAVATDPANRKLLNAASARATDSMADFGRMTPTQRRLARRFLIIPGWLLAGSRYPIHFAATHPGRSAGLAYIGAGEPGAPEELQVNKPVNEYFADWTPSWLPGVPTPWGFERTGSISPVSTAPEIARALAGKQGTTALDYANPVPMGIIDTLRRTVGTPEGGQRRVGLGEAAQENLLGRLVPNYSLAQDLISPPSGEGRIFPDTSRLGRLKREAGVLPVKVNRLAAEKSRLYESGTKAEKASYNLDADYRATLRDLARVGHPPTPEQRKILRHAFVLSAAIAKATAGKETSKDKILAALRVNKRFKLISPEQERYIRAQLGHNTEAMNASLFDKIQNAYGGSVRRRVSAVLNDSLAEQRLEPTEVKSIR